MAPTPETQRLRALLDAARALGASIEHTELLQTILSKMAEIMDAEACSVFIHDRAAGELVMHAPHGEKANQLLSFRMPDTKGIAGSVFQSRQPLNVADAQNDPRFFREADRKSGFTTRALMCAPLLDKGECLGVIQVLNPRNSAAFSDEDAGVFEGFALLATSALIRLRSQQEQLRRKSIEQELSIAREIQQVILSARLPPAACVRLAVFNAPARQISGDFYSVEELPDGRVLVTLGDVSGKGIPAALTMARATAEIRALAPGVDNLGEWMTRLNRALCRDSVGGRFIALTALLFDPAAREVQACAAGQFPPWLRHGTTWAPLPLPTQLALGIADIVTYEAARLPLEPEDPWLLFSDGVTEARDATGAEFTAERLADALPPEGLPNQVLDAVLARLSAFTGNASTHDDTTLLIAAWRGSPPPAAWSIAAEPASLHQARQHVERWAQFAGFDDKDVGCLVLGADEAAANVIRYAYADRPPGRIDYEASLDENGLLLRMRDYGKPVDPEHLKGRDTADIRPGGLGLHLMRCTFNEVRFEPHADGTTLHLRKALPGSPEPAPPSP